MPSEVERYYEITIKYPENGDIVPNEARYRRVPGASYRTAIHKVLYNLDGNYPSLNSRKKIKSVVVECRSLENIS